MSRLNLTHVRRSAPTIAIAAALVAISASSGATAALVITGKDIKDNTVTTKDLKDNNVKGKDIKNGSLTTKDLSSSTVSSLKGATGPAGAPGISGYQIVTASASIAADSGAQVTGSCPAGKRVLSAAAEVVNSYDGTGVAIDLNGTSAIAYGYNSNPTADTLVIDVICATVS